VTHADLAEAGPGVRAAIAKPDRGAVGNAAIVDLGGSNLVVDTHVTPAAARELRAQAEPVSWVLNTHWHADHVLGNGEFGEATIVSTTRTRELIASVGAKRLEERRREGGAGDELLEELRLPDETFEEDRDFGRARALTLGGGHTESDAVLLIPDAGVLVAGDLVVVDMQPWAGHGDPAAWAQILEQLLELEWETVVPGHGPVSGREVVEPLRDYLAALDQAVVNEAELPNRFRDWGQPDMWAVNIAALRER
jgi:glyoxylase-like metal-dependent hydrolase (beta-lactamase superfamily II)